MIKKIKKNNTGVSLVEIIFYIGLFAILFITLINSMISMMNYFKEASIQREIAQSGEIIERISREVRKAYEITTISTSGNLLLQTKNDADQNVPVEFILTDSNIRLLESGTFIGNLNSPKIRVLSLNFNQMNTTKGKAVKILLTVKASFDSKNRNYNFYDTVVLRGKY